MLRRAIAVGGGSLLRGSPSFSARPVLSSTNLFRSTVRSLSTTSKAHEHYSKAFKTIYKPASSPTPAPPTNPYPTTATSPSTPTQPSDTPSPTTSTSSPLLPPRLGTPVPYARRLSSATPSPFHATPPDEPVNPFDDPNSILGRLWDGFAYFFRTFLQGLLVFGWVLVATRIVLTFYPPEEWGKSATDTDIVTATATVATVATATGSTSASSAALVPVVVESNSQTAAQ